MRTLSSWRDEKAWADAHASEIERVVKSQLGDLMTIGPSSLKQDREEAIDYEIKVSGAHIACRIRRADKCDFRDLTITTHRPSGSTPEAMKIIDGDVRWYIYAWARNGRFDEWMFVDLDVVRRTNLIAKALLNGHEHVHADGSKFLSISFDDLAAHGAVLDFDIDTQSRGIRS